MELQNTFFAILTKQCLIILLIHTSQAQDLPKSLPDVRFHLTAHPWQPLAISPDQYLDAAEGICRVAKQHQNEQGAIIDPYLQREHQYSTPYYAFAVGTLLSAGRAEDLLPSGILAMEHATKCFAEGSQRIPDAHGEFFIAPLTHALELYREHVEEQILDKWRNRMKTPLSTVMTNFTGRINNWRTYAMKGEWMRAKAGLVPPDSAADFIERGWNTHTQRERIVLDKWNLYQDWSSDPQSHAVEAVGRGNLAALVSENYEGISADEIKQNVRRGTQTSLLLQSPAGQCPPNGRTDNHVFNDILYQLIFEVMAQDAWERGEKRLAGQYRHAAMLSFQSILRWQREDTPWEGSFYITKNFFEPGDRVGYQPASQWGNYSGAMMFHLAEAFLAAQTRIEEQPAPTEIGGYAFSTDARFSTFVANAGGMQVFVNLRGASVPKYGLSWTPLGVVRFSKTGWDDRLGPSDGKHIVYDLSDAEKESAPNELSGKGISFGPAWLQNNQWIQLADLPADYQVTPTVHFVHPLLVKFSLTYHYVTGSGGPYFKQDFVVTPDGILTKLYAMQDAPFSLSVPLLVHDGRPLYTTISNGIASTAYPDHADQQHFISLNQDVQIEDSKDSLQSTYGWLRSVRFQTKSDTNIVFVYPRKATEPEALSVKESFALQNEGFTSIVSSVQNNIYIGTAAAGGEGEMIDYNLDGEIDVRFNKSCQFILQLEGDQVIAAEVDRPVTMQIAEKIFSMEAYQPKQF